MQSNMQFGQGPAESFLPSRHSKGLAAISCHLAVSDQKIIISGAKILQNFSFFSVTLCLCTEYRIRLITLRSEKQKEDPSFPWGGQNN